jgi:hypothetical protein
MFALLNLWNAWPKALPVVLLNREENQSRHLGKKSLG